MKKCDRDNRDLRDQRDNRDQRDGSDISADSDFSSAPFVSAVSAVSFVPLVPFLSSVPFVPLRELVCLLLVHRCEELVVVAGEVHLLLQELHGLDGGHIRKVFAQYPCALHNAL